MTETPLRVGGRYDLAEVLGRGGMADVRRARDSVLGREVAIKLLRTTDELDRSRFDSEARLLALLSHENIVTVLDAGVDDGRAWLALELIDGDTLADRYRLGPLDATSLAALGAQVAAALQHAHRHGIVHRDVKPSNVLVDGTDRARLTDFGIARLVDDRSALTMTGHAVGTAAYIAPEQVSGEPVTTASDVYALGLLLLEGLTGRREYPGPPVEAALARLQRSPLVPVSLPTGWPSLIAAMTARRPEDRPTADAVAQRLQALGSVRAPQVAGPLSTASLPVLVPPPAPVGAERGSRRRPGWVLAGVAAAVALVVAGSALLLSGSPGESPVDSVVETTRPPTSAPAPVARTTTPVATSARASSTASSTTVPVVTDPDPTTPATPTRPTKPTTTKPKGPTKPKGSDKDTTGPKGPGKDKGKGPGKSPGKGPGRR
ncbi:serine/threonine-protein kinase [Nocardioides plantarum]|uniref:non-specific serine/threonine protein kinase n=1 Tax=Nocardioides plantarum TaxID=29299 RepID=A0ABV5KB92_9ACTN|nr:serine/threonine-protein kinase [Nocardioides plantarum]